MGWMRFSAGEFFEPVAKGAPEVMVVLLHDRTDSPEGLIPVIFRWTAAVPTAAFMLPSGVERHHTLTVDADQEPAATPHGTAEWAEIDRAVRRLAPLITQQLSRYGLEPNQLVLVGVGYGGTLALHMGLRCGLNYAGILAFAGRVDRSLSRIASSNGKVRLVMPTEEHRFGHGFMGGFVAHLNDAGIDARGVLLTGPTLSEAAIRHGGAYLAELVATAQRSRPRRFGHGRK